MARGTGTGEIEVLGWAPWAVARMVAPPAGVPLGLLPRGLSPHPPPARPPGRRRRIALGLAVAGAATAGLGFLAFVDSIEDSERAPSGRTDGIVALTGGAGRIEDAIDLLASGRGRRLLITGVNERTSRDEIARQVDRLNPGQRHLVACCVDLDYRARNTIGNAIETRRWMRENGFRSVAVVTSNYHMPRTLVELGHALVPDERVVPYPVVTDAVATRHWWRSPAAARLLAGEYAKFVVAWVRTRFEHDPERSRAAVLMGRGKPVRVVAGPIAGTMAGPVIGR